jgi:hypothetical protein
MCKSNEECEHKKVHPLSKLIYSNFVLTRFTAAGGGVFAFAHSCLHIVMHGFGFPCP